jgi:hypothetical protein
VSTDAIAERPEAGNGDRSRRQPPALRGFTPTPTRPHQRGREYPPSGSRDSSSSPDVSMPQAAWGAANAATGALPGVKPGQGLSPRKRIAVAAAKGFSALRATGPSGRLDRVCFELHAEFLP